MKVYHRCQETVCLGTWLIQSFACIFTFTSTSISTNLSGMAIVPYDESAIFSPFYASKRSFAFAGRTLTVHQDWNKFGVAAVVWDAAIVLGRYLEKMSADLKDKRIIELGAGTGFAGIVASLLGGNVTATDRKMALNVTRLNIEKNLGDKQYSIKIKELEWGQNVSSFSPPFDFVLGADIVYIEETFHYLLKTLQDLCDEHTRILLSCRLRYERDKRFFELLSKHFMHEKVAYDEELDIIVYEARKISWEKFNRDVFQWINWKMWFYRRIKFFCWSINSRSAKSQLPGQVQGSNARLPRNKHSSALGNGITINWDNQTNW